MALVPVLSWVIWWGLAFWLQDREAVCIQWITKFIVLLYIAWFCRRLAQLLSEGFCNGRSDSPLLSVAVCDSSKGGVWNNAVHLGFMASQCRWIPLFLVHSCITYTKGGVFNFFKIFSSCETLNIQVRNLLWIMTKLFSWKSLQALFKATSFQIYILLLL